MPQIILLCGANGSGKSTTAPSLLSRVGAFLNADEIAKELTAAGSDKPDLLAGRLLLQQWEALAAAQEDFAVETTLATRGFAPRLRRMKEAGYRVHLQYMWLPNPEVAIARVRERVRHGGHDIPEETIRRRYRAGLQNFFTLYRPLANTWRVYDNTRLGQPTLVARGTLTVLQGETWKQIEQPATLP